MLARCSGSFHGRDKYDVFFSDKLISSYAEGADTRWDPLRTYVGCHPRPLSAGNPGRATESPGSMVSFTQLLCLVNTAKLNQDKKSIPIV